MLVGLICFRSAAMGLKEKQRTFLDLKSTLAPAEVKQAQQFLRGFESNKAETVGRKLS